jgi:hypothetical protein
MVERGHPMSVRERGRGDEEVVLADRPAACRELGPQSSVNAGNEKIERNHRDRAEDLFDEAFSSNSLGRRRRAVHPVQKLRGGDGRQEDRLLGKAPELFLQVGATTLDADENA